VPLDLVAEAAAEPAERPLERVIGERLHLAAVVANDVVMVLAAGEHWLVASGVAEIETLHESKSHELLERPVHAREPDRAAFGSERVEDLGGAQAAVLLREKLDDGATRLTAAIPATSEGLTRPAHPLVGGWSISRASAQGHPVLV
jgi:hypothetical protein